ncbi:pDP96R [African swine fever virus]|uniref:PDP96R n=1 Tax=African swine fever virus TaxID=10497 RepID=A0A8A1UDM1_ASF|nr:pDP96R [African swine fever virus]
MSCILHLRNRLERIIYLRSRPKCHHQNGLLYIGKVYIVETTCHVVVQEKCPVQTKSFQCLVRDTYCAPCRRMFTKKYLFFWHVSILCTYLW